MCCLAHAAGFHSWSFTARATRRVSEACTACVVLLKQRASILAVSPRGKPDASARNVRLALPCSRGGLPFSEFHHAGNPTRQRGMYSLRCLAHAAGFHSRSSTTRVARRVSEECMACVALLTRRASILGISPCGKPDASARIVRLELPCLRGGLPFSQTHHAGNPTRQRGMYSPLKTSVPHARNRYADVLRAERVDRFRALQ